MTHIFSLSRDEHISSRKFFIAAEKPFDALKYFIEQKCLDYLPTIRMRRLQDGDLVYISDGRYNINGTDATKLRSWVHEVPSVVVRQDGFRVYEIAYTYGIVAPTEEDALEVFRHIISDDEQFGCIISTIMSNRRYYKHGTGATYVCPLSELWDSDELTIVGNDGVSVTNTAEWFVRRELEKGMFVGSLLYVKDEQDVLHEGYKVWKY